MKRAYKPECAATIPGKINVTLPNGKTVLRAVRWYNFLPNWLDSAEPAALVPYVVIKNTPYIITTHNGKISGLVSLAAYLKSYGVELWTSSSGRDLHEWWRYIQ